MSYEELIDTENILLALAQNENNQVEFVKGWRILSKTHLEDSEIFQLINQLNDLQVILESKKDRFESIIGNEKAIVLAKDLARIKNQ